MTDDKQTVLLGGYTRRGGHGIMKAEFNLAAEKLEIPQTYFGELISPTYLAIGQDGFIYAVAAGEGEGGVAVIDGNAETPVLVDTVLTHGGSPAHLSLDEEHRLLFASYYHDGKLTVYHIEDDHHLTIVTTVYHHGGGPRPEQDGAHIHFAKLTPDGRYLTAVDLGTDEVYNYPIDASGKLNTPAILKLDPGFGPRHLRFHPTKPIAYLLGELSSTLMVLTYDAETGIFTPGESVSTLPDDWKEFNGAAAIRLSSDGRFVYISNRGENTLHAFAISEDGLHLADIQSISTEGDFPRDFALDLSEQYVLAANQNSDNATLYKRDSDSGKLTLLQKDIPAAEAVNVHFTNIL